MDRRAAISIAAAAAVVIGVSMALTFQTFNAALEVPAGNQKIGLVVNSPAVATDVQTISDIYAQAASTGIGRSNVYVFWDMVEPEKGEFDWEYTDILMSLNRNNDLKVTLYFSVINGKMLGPFPDWAGGPDLDSIDGSQVAEVLDAILARYHIIDTVIIAGEADEHFRYSQEDIPVYRGLFEDVYGELKPKHPNVLFGNAYSLHGVINKGLEGTVAKLSDVGDFVGFTYFPVDSLNDIVKTPEQAVQDLEYALEVAGGKKVAFFEVSWSTSDFVNGDELGQERFISEAFGFYNENSRDIEFLTWYRQYDRPGGSCSLGEETVGSGGITVGGSSSLGSSEYVAERLGNYVCNAGLIGSDGIPKAGWGEFASQVSKST